MDVPLLFSAVYADGRRSTAVQYAFLLNQKKEGSGAASSLINAVHTAAGCAGMAAGTISWTDLIYGLGLIMAGASFAALAGWIVFLCGSFSVRGVK